MRYLLAVLLFTSLVQYADAQFNDTTHYHLNVVANGSINQSNGDHSYLLNNAFNFSIKQKSYALNSTNSWVYGKQNSLLTNNDYSSTLNFNLYKTFPHFYYWALANYNTSYSLKIYNQLITGLGIAYNIVDKKSAKVNLSDGIVYDQSDLVTDHDYHTYRNSLRLQFHFKAKDIFTLDGSNYWQPSLSNHNDYIISTNTTLGLKIMKWLSFTTMLSYNRMEITNSDNLIFTYGLSIDKYF
jgi:hypothetical protein